MKSVYFFFVSFCLIACDGLYAPTAKPTTDTITNNNVTQNIKPPSQQPSQWGIISCADNDSAEKNFFLQIQLFLSTIIDPQTIRTAVICSNRHRKRKNLHGGLWIKAQIQFQENQKFSRLSPNQQLTVSENSYLTIQVINAENRYLASIKMYIIPFGGSVNGSSVNLAFKDAKGKVSLQGQVDNKGFLKGDFYYTNYIDWRGRQSNVKGSIGKFSIFSCSLLDCSK